MIIYIILFVGIGFALSYISMIDKKMGGNNKEGEYFLWWIISIVIAIYWSRSHGSFWGVISFIEMFVGHLIYKNNKKEI